MARQQHRRTQRVCWLGFDGDLSLDGSVPDRTGENTAEHIMEMGSLLRIK